MEKTIKWTTENSWMKRYTLKSLYKRQAQLIKWINKDKDRLKQYQKRLKQIEYLIRDELK